MTLEHLIKEVEVIKVIGNKNIEISDIQLDSNCLTKDSLFVCLNGRDFDGHTYVKQAENYGAVAIVCERELDTALTQVVVKNSRKAMSQISAEFYNHPERKLKLVGVTGTNGKTTTAHLIYNILKNAKRSCGLIGTLGVYYNDVYKESALTTPDPLKLHKIFNEMVNEGINTVVMEVSAHALFLDKVSNLNFEVAIFTNLTQDHLDFFENIDEYERAKLKFFRKNKCKFIVSNSDDKTGLKIASEFPKTITYGIENPADVFALDLVQKRNKQKFIINLFDCIYDVSFNLIGKFNVYNALAASSVCALLGVPCDKVMTGLEKVKGVSGRLERVYDDYFSVYVDYAHTPDGIEKSLTALREVCSNRLICVFGCGGNRDKDKRSKMGYISGKTADFTVITSDNYRYEEPMDIIFMIEEGIKTVTNNYVAIQDRVDGIRYALNMAKEGDVVLVAGKGAEKYQEVFGIKKPYNDKDTIEEIMENEF